MTGGVRQQTWCGVEEAAVRSDSLGPGVSKEPRGNDLGEEESWLWDRGWPPGLDCPVPDADPERKTHTWHFRTAVWLQLWSMLQKADLDGTKGQIAESFQPEQFSLHFLGGGVQLQRAL